MNLETIKDPTELTTAQLVEYLRPKHKYDIVDSCDVASALHDLSCDYITDDVDYDLYAISLDRNRYLIIEKGLYWNTIYAYPVTSDSSLKALIDVLNGHDHGDGDFPEYLAKFRIEAKDYLNHATDDYEGQCKIFVSYEYSSEAFNAPKDGYVSEDCNDVLRLDYIDEDIAINHTVEDGVILFDTFGDVQKYVKLHYKARYYLSNGEGEYARPELYICKADIW